MNAHSKITEGTSTVFKLNRSQAVRIPKHLAFPEGVREVYVRRKGEDWRLFLYRISGTIFLTDPAST